MISTTKRGRIGLVIGVVIAGLGIAGTLILRSGSSSSNTNNGQQTTVVVAVADIQGGTQISKGMLTTTSLPSSAVPVGALTDPAAGEGKYAISTILAHQVIVPSLITDIGGTAPPPDTGTGTTGTAAGATPITSFALKSGDVAVAMPVDPESAVGYYIQPGDHVDFVMTSGGSGGGVQYGFQDVLILRVGGAVTAAGGAATRQDGLIVVELPRRQAEQLTAILDGVAPMKIDKLVLRSKDQYGKGYLPSGADNPYTTSPNDPPVTSANLAQVFPH